MRIFVTGATGFVGFAVVQELIGAGHQVLGLARSEEGARALIAAGAEVHRGELEDLEGLRRGAARSEGVIHTAFIHDFSKFAACCETDRLAIEALGSELVGSDRPLIVTAGVGHGTPGRLRTEDDPPAAPSAQMPRASEQAAAAVLARGVRVSVVRLPQVHDRVKQGLITYAIDVARERGVSAYLGEGLNRWAAVPRHDAAHVYRLALEKGAAGANYHAVAEEGVPFREIAEAIGRGLTVPVVSLPPEKAGEHFGWLASFAGGDMPASSALTRERLGWHPTGPGLIADLDHVRYFGA
ncbi:SDR family oxidoreductase [Frigoriglobus tundricola]|uniref:Epimerase domain-containing protein n=1 Tax=Frigoriglobus tundricola TaxID=2774151 RepID=A0A6M5Z0R4_9BACT|nr:SDR family oxidoreductase [Frigoriglobus tundricola]QJW99758.1 Epimerase domain-containing protein [Frigoriglobus tundricola]